MSRGGKRPGAGRPANKPITLNIRLSPANLRRLRQFFEDDEEEMIESLNVMVESYVRQLSNNIRTVYEQKERNEKAN